MMKFAVSLLLLLTSFIGVSSAEDVYVKYRGRVSLDPFECRTITRSSLVERVCFDPRAAYLLINLKGTYYQYCRVPQALVIKFLNADSMGRFFNAHIKGNFNCSTSTLSN